MKIVWQNETEDESERVDVSIGTNIDRIPETRLEQEKEDMIDAVELLRQREPRIVDICLHNVF